MLPRISSLLIILLFSGLAQSAEIEGLRVWQGPERTRAVFDLSATTEYRLFTLSSPDRVVIDLKQSRFKSGAVVPDVGDGVLDQVRSGRRGDSDLRIVFDLAASASAKSFLLKPTDPYGHRLVVDFYPSDSSPVEPVKVAADTKRSRDVVIAIDAGHGGEDPGAIGPSGTHEKDVVLKIAKEVERLLEAEPGMKPVMVRSGDYYIAHKGRTKKARDHRADLFISIHADAFYDSKVRGSSVFYLSQGRATSEAGKWLADRENRADLVGGVKLDDKDDTLAAVLLDLSQSASMEASIDVADDVLQSLKRVGPTHKKQVEGASFAVLTAPDIPSILVETANISNHKEEKYLKSQKWRRKTAAAIVNGLREHFYESPPPGTWLAENRTEGQHIVLAGQTLSEIASDHRVSLSRLRAVNHIKGDLVRTGAVLRIPAGSP
jgi:N-acetylmuramoyl-L-alanine amidase